MNAAVTIFVSTYNRTDTLLRTLRSFQRFSAPYEVVIIDNGTGWAPARALLADLERDWTEVREVKRYGYCSTLPEVVANINRAVQSRYRQRPHTPWYAVTDADICFEGSSPDCLDAYIHLYQCTEDSPGPHTRVDASIPMHYPLRSRVLATESKTMYRSDQLWCNGIPYSIWAIDTTFHLFPRMDGFQWQKLDTLRCGPPYDAMHLDWYANIFDPSEETKVYLENAVSSWGAMWLRGFWRRFQTDPSAALRAILLDGARNPQIDLKNEYFIASWCLQNGITISEFEDNPGTWSVEMLRLAIPANRPEWLLRDDWMQMIYANDFSSLGWSDA